MKGRLLIAAVVLFFFGACNKKTDHSIKPKPASEQWIVQSKSNDGVLISGWQAVSAWENKTINKDVVLQKSIALPSDRVSEETLVLVFARNVWDDDPQLTEQSEDEPLQMPFKFLPYHETPGYTEHWEYKIENSRLDVVLTTNQPTNRLPEKVELQYLVIPSNLLSRKQQTAETVKQMSYTEIVETFDLQS